MERLTKKLGNLPVIVALIAAMIVVFKLPFMAAATADANTQQRGSSQRIDVYPCAVDIIYKGTLVAINSAGFAKPASDAANERVVGIAEKQIDNSGGSAGDKSVPVRSGCVFRMTASGTLTQAMVGDMLYVDTDQEIEIAGGTTNAVPAAFLLEFVSATVGWFFIPSGGMPRLADAEGTLKVTLVAGGSAGNHTVTGIAVGDRIAFVGHFSTAAAIATLGDLTSEFSVTAANTINNTGGTDTASDQLMVIWIDRTL